MENWTLHGNTIFSKKLTNQKVKVAQTNNAFNQKLTLLNYHQVCLCWLNVIAWIISFVSYAINYNITFFFVDSNSFCKDLLFLHGPNLEQKPPYLVGTVLNSLRGEYSKFLILLRPTHLNLFSMSKFQIMLSHTLNSCLLQVAKLVMVTLTFTIRFFGWLDCKIKKILSFKSYILVSSNTDTTKTLV